MNHYRRVRHARCESSTPGVHRYLYFYQGNGAHGAPYGSVSTLFTEMGRSQFDKAVYTYEYLFYKLTPTPELNYDSSITITRKHHVRNHTSHTQDTSRIGLV